MVLTEGTIFSKQGPLDILILEHILFENRIHGQESLCGKLVLSNMDEKRDEVYVKPSKSGQSGRSWHGTRYIAGFGIWR